MASGVVFLAIALMDLRWGKTTREVPQKGIEVVFALDVSRSMLAEDANPNRLQRAKQQIKDMLNEMAGDRVGLVVFAGEADQAVPLTSHYGDFQQVLDSVGPHSVARGGSRLGVAIEAASKAFIGKTNDHKTIVIFTDGEDQESQPVELAKQLHAENGTRIFTVGLGDMDQGARIPDQESRNNQFVKHQGQQVWSKLNGHILKEIATETNAAYIPAGTKRVDMADVYHGFIAKVDQTEFETARINAFIPRFQWFAAMALACFLLEAWITTRPRIDSNTRIQRKEAAHDFEPKQRRPDSVAARVTKAGAAALVVLCVLVSQLPAQATAVADQINAGNELVRQQKPDEAIDAFNRIDDVDPQLQSRLNFNLAVAHYRNSDYPSAMTLFGESAKSTDSLIAADSRYNLGNCHYAQALEQAGQEPKMAMEQLQKAVDQYRSALRLDRKNEDARANIELARKLLQQLQSQQEQQEQQEQAGDQDQNQEDLDSTSDQQNGSENQNEDTESNAGEQADQQDRPSDSENNQQADPSGQSADGESENDGSGEDNGSSKEQQPSNAAESQRESESKTQPSSAESDEESNPPNGDKTNAPSQRQPEDAQPTDESADGLSETDGPDETSEAPPAGQLSAPNQGPSEDDRNGLSGALQPKGPDELITREEALKILQSVRDRDMLRRLQQQQRRSSRRVQVDKDW